MQCWPWCSHQRGLYRRIPQAQWCSLSSVRSMSPQSTGTVTFLIEYATYIFSMNMLTCGWQLVRRSRIHQTADTRPISGCCRCRLELLCSILLASFDTSQSTSAFRVRTLSSPWFWNHLIVWNLAQRFVGVDHNLNSTCRYYLTRHCEVISCLAFVFATVWCDGPCTVAGFLLIGCTWLYITY